MALIFVVSSIPMTALPIGGVPFKDKGVHFVEFGVLGFLVMRACLMTWPRVAVLRVATFAVGTTVLWGLLDELHQAYVPNRSAEAFDLLADALGAVCGVVFTALAQRWAAAKRMLWMN